MTNASSRLLVPIYSTPATVSMRNMSLVLSRQPGRSQLSEIGQQEQFLHFDKSLQNVLAERPTVNPAAQRSLQGLLVGSEK